MKSLDAWQEWDALVTKVLEAYPKDWRLLRQVALSFGWASHWG